MILNSLNFYQINWYKSHYINICEYNKFSKIINTEKPEFIFHLAAQALVFESYRSPEYTLKIVLFHQ